MIWAVHGDGIDWTEVVGYGTVMVATIVAAWFGYLGVRVSRQTQASNTADHSVVVKTLHTLQRSNRHLATQIMGVRREVSELRSAHMRHLESHIERTTHEEDPPPDL